MEMSVHKCVRFAVLLLVLATGLSASDPVSAQEPSAEVLAKANNPLADLTAFNLQNYHASALYGAPSEVTTNTFWARFAQPTGPVLWRASLPIRTVPHPDGDINGIGDLDLFAAYLLKNSPSGTLGLGPMVTFNTAERAELGTGKTLAGLAAVSFAVPSPIFQVGGLLTWLTDVGGDEARDEVSVMAAQPFAFWQLGGGTYLRTAPIWTFDLRNGNYTIPFGFGIGKVVKNGKTAFNIFIEPQWTILHEGAGQPKFQLYAALNMQFY